MKLYHGISSVAEEHRSGVCVLGNFDGVHRGHQILLERGREHAKNTGLPFGVMSFEPHPRDFFGRTPVFRLSPPNIKPHLFEAMGADYAKIYDFDHEFSSLTARAFVEKTLVQDLSVNAVVCGYDFHFGKGREGTPDILKNLGDQLGFEVIIVPVQKNETHDRVFSSSAIREDLRTGDVQKAAHDLGRWWSMRGCVASGEGQGKFLGFPTANIPLEPSCAMKPGIYAARLRRFGTSEEIYDGAAYIGSKPTFGDFDPRLEIFLFDFDADIYGQDVLVEFISYLRDDMKFDSAEALTAQMKLDCAQAAEKLAQIRETGDPMQAYEMGRFFAP